MDLINMIAERKTLLANANSDHIADDERNLLSSRIIEIENSVADTVPVSIKEMEAKANMIAEAMEWDGCDPVYVRALRAMV